VGTGDGIKLENLLKKCESEKIRNVVAIDPSPLFKLQKHSLINIIQSKTVN